MRQLASEIVNGAIVAALVVLASEAHRQASSPRPTDSSPQAADSRQSPSVEKDAPAGRTESFAASPLSRTTLHTDTSESTSRSDGAVGSAGGAGNIAAVPRDSEQPQTAPVVPDAGKKAKRPQIDAYVPPIRRQRPVTPPLASDETPDNAGSAARKATRTKVKKATSRKAGSSEPSRSSLGANAR